MLGPAPLVFMFFRMFTSLRGIVEGILLFSGDGWVFEIVRRRTPTPRKLSGERITFLLPGLRFVATGSVSGGGHRVLLSFPYWPKSHGSRDSRWVWRHVFSEDAWICILWVVRWWDSKHQGSSFYHFTSFFRKAEAFFPGCTFNRVCAVCIVVHNLPDFRHCSV